MSHTAFIETLAQRGTGYELLPHPHTETATAEARALGIPPEQTAKTVIVRTPDGFVRAIVPASRRVDLARLRKVLGTDDIALATEAELVGAYPSFELGAVPPFDAADPDEVIVDRHLCEVDSVVFEAGTHDLSVRLRTSDFLKLSNARLAEICEH